LGAHKKQCGALLPNVINTCMKFAWITLVIALAIAGIAAWFSIVGLMAIFTGAALSIAIMAGALEAGKLAAASWLYRYWKTSPWFLKIYLTLAVVVLMIITSMGIFGYLSRAHIEHTAGLSTNAAQIEFVELEIARATRERDAADAQLAALDSAVTEMIQRGFATRGLETRAAQAVERTALSEIISNADSTIAGAQARQLEMSLEIQSLEREVGPVLYLAQVIYGSSERDIVEETVRLLIIILVLVFDPLAISLLLAANFALMRHNIILEQQDQFEPSASQLEEESNDQSSDTSEINKNISSAEPSGPDGSIRDHQMGTQTDPTPANTKEAPPAVPPINSPPTETGGCVGKPSY
jgi:hypothetical protein